MENAGDQDERSGRDETRKEREEDDPKEEEEEGECPFCLFMKSGPCGKEFQEWEDCVQEAEKVSEETVVRCRSITQVLMKCMEGESYYSVVLQAGEKLGAADVDRGGEEQEQSQQQPQQKQDQEEQKEVQQELQVQQTSQDQVKGEEKEQKEEKEKEQEQDKGRFQVHVQVEDRQGMAA